MPIYEYKCEQCGRQFDFLAKRLSDRPEACPDCGAPSLRKQLSTFSARIAVGPTGGESSCPSGTCCPGGTCSLN